MNADKQLKHESATHSVTQSDYHRAPVPKTVPDIKEWWSSEIVVRRKGSFLQILELIRQERPMHGEMPVRDILAKGELGKKPYDVSSLAIELRLPRTSVTRLVNYLESTGAVFCQMKGRRKEILLTDKGWIQIAELWEKVDQLLDSFILEQSKDR